MRLLFQSFQAGNYHFEKAGNNGDKSQYEDYYTGDFVNHYKLFQSEFFSENIYRGT